MTNWTMDTVHSEVRFKIKHLMISTVTGHFETFSGTMTASQPDFSDAKIAFEAEVKSINTNNEQRDGHLQNDDFFDAINNPKLTFVSSSISKKSDDEYALGGDLTIRGITRPVTLNVNYTGTAKDFAGIDTAGFEITGKVNRKEFGLKFDALTETGGIAVGDEVKLEIITEMKKS